MASLRRTAFIAGLLFLIATVSFIAADTLVKAVLTERTTARSEGDGPRHVDSVFPCGASANGALEPALAGRPRIVLINRENACRSLRRTVQRVLSIYRGPSPSPFVSS